MLNIPDEAEKILTMKRNSSAPENLNSGAHEKRRLTISRLFDPSSELEDDNRQILPWSQNDPIVRSFSVKEDANKKGTKKKGNLAKLQASETEVLEYQFFSFSFLTLSLFFIFVKF